MTRQKRTRSFGKLRSRFILRLLATYRMWVWVSWRFARLMARLLDPERPLDPGTRCWLLRQYDGSINDFCATELGISAGYLKRLVAIYEWARDNKVPPELKLIPIEVLERVMSLDGTEAAEALLPKMPNTVVECLQESPFVHFTIKIPREDVPPFLDALRLARGIVTGNEHEPQKAVHQLRLISAVGTYQLEKLKERGSDSVQGMDPLGLIARLVKPQLEQKVLMNRRVSDTIQGALFREYGIAECACNYRKLEMSSRLQAKVKPVLYRTDAFCPRCTSWSDVAYYMGS